MKLILIIQFCFIVLFTFHCKSDSDQPKQFFLKGKIVDPVQLTPGCGVIAWGTVIEFEVVTLVGINYTNKKIGIIVTCPGDYEDNFFEPGKLYEVVFSDENQADFEWAMFNEELLKVNGLSFDPYAIEVKKLHKSSPF
jgi:hypothetical protein